VAPPRLSVLTLNLRNLADRWDERLPLLLAEFAALQPDVAGLQEIVYVMQQDRLLGASGAGQYEARRGWAGRPEVESLLGWLDGLPQAEASVVTGDFNSDGQDDLAAVLKVGNTVRLVVILNRKEDATIIELDTMGQSAADGYLGIRRRGDEFKNPGDSLADYFVVDTLQVLRCGQPPTVYFWSGAAFRKSTLSTGQANVLSLASFR